jgi:hypothetical protein
MEKCGSRDEFGNQVALDEAWNTHESTVIDGLPVPMLSKELLIKNKRASGRPKDLEDVRQLQAE